MRLRSVSYTAESPFAGVKYTAESSFGGVSYTTESTAKGLKTYFSQYTSRCIFFSSNRPKWVPKNAEFYSDSKSEYKIVNKCSNKKLFEKLAKKQFIENIFLSCVFLNFCLQICNQRKILRFLIPM